MGIELIWSPIYSPDMNPIELMHSILKQSVKKQRLADMLKATKRQYRQILPNAIGEISKEKINNCIDHVLKLFKIY